jgi:hypothetical protein
VQREQAALPELSTTNLQDSVGQNVRESKVERL